MPVRKITLSKEDAESFDSLMEAMGYTYTTKTEQPRRNPSAFAADLAEAFRKSHFIASDDQVFSAILIKKTAK